MGTVAIGAFALSTLMLLGWSLGGGRKRAETVDVDEELKSSIALVQQPRYVGGGRWMAGRVTFVEVDPPMPEHGEIKIGGVGR